ncbi:MAG: hypothetical protein M0Z43_00275 [Acidithiobacillus sp.]|nr:hypothetical protein [Acidithiobacillus sp.]
MDTLGIYSLFISGFVAALMQAVGHYFKWEIWMGHELNRLASYTWGTTAMFVGMVIWASISMYRQVQSWEALLAFGIIAITSGGTVSGLYGLDALGERVHYARTRDLMDANADDDKGGK